MILKSSFLEKESYRRNNIDVKKENKKMKKNSKNFLWAFIWIAVGVIWMMSNYGKLPISFTWSKDWPVIFIIIGLATLFKLIVWRGSVEKKSSCTINLGNNKNIYTDGTMKAKWLKIRVYKNHNKNPEVKITIPIAVIKGAIKLGGKLNISMPEKAREKMAEKGIYLDSETFENIDELLNELAVNGRYDIINVIDEKAGERVEIYVE
ncbi:MAG: hypothetical protein DRI44_01195 [Chlamydiae bacterium]|nr:MAG: hypothetical protein DRI44_01195 [Chlamydiota bacterium]